MEALIEVRSVYIYKNVRWMFSEIVLFHIRKSANPQLYSLRFIVHLEMCRLL